LIRIFSGVAKLAPLLRYRFHVRLAQNKFCYSTNQNSRWRNHEISN